MDMARHLREPVAVAPCEAPQVLLIRFCLGGLVVKRGVAAQPGLPVASQAQPLTTARA